MIQIGDWAKEPAKARILSAKRRDLISEGLPGIRSEEKINFSIFVPTLISMIVLSLEKTFTRE
jgi:hypothetical protein